MPATKRGIRLVMAAALCVASAGAMADEPVAKCVWKDGDTVRCRGGYSNGKDAIEAPIEAIALDGKVLAEGKLDARSLFTFKKPAQAFYVLLNVMPGHQVVIEQEEILPVAAQRRVAKWMTSP